MAAPITENTMNARMIQSATLINPTVMRARLLDLQLASRQLTIRPEVLFACPQRNLLWEGRRRRLFVPADFFEVVPYILLVIRIPTPSDTSNEKGTSGTRAARRSRSSSKALMESGGSHARQRRLSFSLASRRASPG